MNQQDENQDQLILPRTDIVGKKAFDGDLLQREKLAEDLTGYIDRLRAGAVLAIDAPWGEGKTWFGRNWAKRLEDEKRTVVFIDAFEQDYMEDPFLLLAAEIAEIMDDKGIADDLRKTAVGVMKAIVPMLPKIILNVGGRAALGSNGFESVSNEIADTTGKLIEDKIKNHAQEKDSLKDFRNALTEFAADQGDKPVVIIIDELDRCKPTFAVQLLERVKHLFDVPNLVFVLLLNRNQLEKAVKGVYGAETEASAYLGKFVNFFFMLPKRTSVNPIANDHVKDYVTYVFKRYNFENDGRQIFENHMSVMATIFNMSLRDIEKAIALYAFAQPIDIFDDILAYVIALKIVNADLFQRLSKGDSKAHEEARANIDILNQKLNKFYLNLLSEWHEAHIDGFKEEVGDNFKLVCNDLHRYNISRERLFHFLAERIDLTIEQ